MVDPNGSPDRVSRGKEDTMAVDVLMPQMGDSIFEGTITKWLKKPGDKVRRDEPLFEISTEKVDAEIPSPAAGTLVEIKVDEGETVSIHTVVGVIDAESDSRIPGTRLGDYLLANRSAVADLQTGSPLLPLTSQSSTQPRPISQQPTHDVFIVHGHDNAAKDSVARLLERLGLHPVILHEQPNKGLTIVEKFEAHSNPIFAVVLLTPDDFGGSAASTDKSCPRARQNVVLEMGYFLGKLGRSRVCVLYMQGVEIPSDMHGIVYVAYDANGGWRLQLAKEIKAAGVQVDFNRIW